MQHNIVQQWPPRAFDTATSYEHLRETLLPGTVAAVERTADVVGRSFDSQSRPRDFGEIKRLLDENDALGEAVLREALTKLLPSAGWADEAGEDGALPPGDWWVTDACEGNINKVHGVPEFCTSATLVRDNRPVLCAVNLPLADITYTAVAGGGAHENGRRLRVSDKTKLDGAFVATCQTGPFEKRETAAKIGRAATELLVRNAILRVCPPPTLQLLPVARGAMDAFFLFGSERAGLLAGGLMAAEAGAIVTDIEGRPWSLASATIVAAAPNVHGELCAFLAGVAGDADRTP